MKIIDREEVFFRFQGLAGLLVDTSRAEARGMRAFVRIFQNGELVTVSASSAPLQRSPTEDLLSKSRIIRHVAVWEDNSISVKLKSPSLRFQIFLKFPSGSSLPVGQCDWLSSSPSGNIDLQVRAFRVEGSAVRIDSEGDAILRAHVNGKHDQQIAESLGSLEYSYSKSETMMDTTVDLVGSAISMESILDENGCKITPVRSASKTNSSRKKKDRVASTNDRFLASKIEMSPSIAMDPLAIRRLFHPKKVAVIDHESEESDDSVVSPQSNALPVDSSDDNDSHDVKPKSAAVAVSKEHLEYLARNKSKVIAPSSVSSAASSHVDAPLKSRTPSPLPIPPVESIEFEINETLQAVTVTPSPSQKIEQPKPKTRALSKRLFGEKKMRKKNKRNSGSLIAFEDREDSKEHESTTIKKRSFKIKSFFIRQRSVEKIAPRDENGDVTKQMAVTSRERGYGSQTPTAEINYTLLSASATQPLPEGDEDATKLSNDLKDARQDSLLLVRDQNVTPVDDFCNPSVVENYFSGKPFFGTAGLVHITPETATTDSTTPEREQVDKSLPHQPILVEAIQAEPRLNGKNYQDGPSLSSEIQDGDIVGEDNLFAIHEKRSPSSSSSYKVPNRIKQNEVLSKQEQKPTKPENRRTLDASVSFDAGVHGSSLPLPDKFGDESKTTTFASINKETSDPLFFQKMDWEPFDRISADDQPWVASTFGGADSAFSGVSSRWRQRSDEDTSYLPWESLLMPQVEKTLNGHVNGEKVTIDLNEISCNMSQSYDSPPGTEDPTLVSIVETKEIEKCAAVRPHDMLSSEAKKSQTRLGKLSHVSHHDHSRHDSTRNVSPDIDTKDASAEVLLTDANVEAKNLDNDVENENDVWIIFDPDDGENDTSALNSTIEEEVILFDFREQVPKNSYIRGIGSLVDWDAEVILDENDIFEDALQHIDTTTISEKIRDDVASASGKLNYSILSEARMVDLHPTTEPSLKQSNDPKPKSLPTKNTTVPPILPFPLHYVSEKDKKCSVAKKKKKNFVRKFGESLIGLLACGSKAHIVASSDDEVMLYEESQPLWIPPPSRPSTKKTGQKKAVPTQKSKRQSQRPEQEKMRETTQSAKEQEQDNRNSSVLSYEQIISPVVSDAEDLAWAKSRAARNWI